MRFDSDDGAVLALHNLSSDPRGASVRLSSGERSRLRALFSSTGHAENGSPFDLDGWGYRWFRLR